MWKKREIFVKIICIIGVMFAILIFNNKGVYAAADKNVKIQFSVTSVKVDKNKAVSIYYSTSMYYGGVVSWKINNGNIATAKADYAKNKITIYGQKPGTTSIKISLDNGNSSTCTIKVVDPTTVKFSVSNITVNKGGSYSIYYSTSMYYGGVVSWKINNGKIATATANYAQNKITIYGNKHGNTNIKLWLENGNSTTCNIKVIDPTTVRFSVGNITVNRSGSYSIYYSTSRYYDGAISWKINNGKIATAKANYAQNKITIYGNTPGNTNIKLWLENGNSTTCNIKVVDPTTVKFSLSSISIKEGESKDIYYSTSMYYGGVVSWKINNGSVATATADYAKNKITIYGKSSGNTNIKLWLENGKSTTCNITVDSKIIASAKKINSGICSYKDYSKKYDYCDLGGTCRNNSNDHKHGHKCGLNETFEQSKTSYHNTCCATYVSWILRDAGIINTTIHGADSLASYLKNSGKFKVVSDIKAGDILCYNGHIEISAGGNKVYTGGDVDAINTLGPTTKNNINPHTILRLK